MYLISNLTPGVYHLSISRSFSLLRFSTLVWKRLLPRSAELRVPPSPGPSGQLLQDLVPELGDTNGSNGKPSRKQDALTWAMQYQDLLQQGKAEFALGPPEQGKEPPKLTLALGVLGTLVARQHFDVGVMQTDQAKRRKVDTAFTLVGR